MQIDRPIAIALILFAVLLLVFFLVAPEYKVFSKLRTELAEKKAEYNAEIAYYNEINKTFSNLQEHKDDVKKVDDALPEDPDLGRIIYFLQQAGEDSGMVIKNLFLSKSAAVTTKTGQKAVREITFSMEVLGDYNSLESFLTSLEASDRIFEVFNISFGSDQTLGGPSTFNLQIKTYSY